MATARRRMPTRRGDNPSQVLIIFLVFFIILSIGLGAGTYFGFAGQKTYFDQALKEKKVAKEADEKRDDARFRAREAVAMLSGQDEEGRAADREEFVKDGGKFGSVTDKAKFMELMKTAEKDLGFDNGSKKYNDSYAAKVDKLTKKVALLEAENKNLLDAKKATDDLYNTLRASFQGDFNKLKKDIAAGHAAALAAAKEKSEEVEKLAKGIEEKNTELAAAKDTFEKEIRKKDALIEKIRQAKGLVAAPGEEGEKVARAPAEIHSLVLDVSRGTTLWDRARGKIIRMDATGRRPYLNIGAAQGVKTGLTFNVFAAGPDGKAKGLLKGTLEIIAVQNNISQASVTAVFDAEGREIPLADSGRSQLFRESDNPLREGDLLFNLVWKEHIAIAGPVGARPGGDESPAQQMRDLQRYMHTLAGKGVVVDAYVNLLDGKVVGAVTPDTGYLVPGFMPLTKEEQEGKDDRAKAVRAGMEELKKQAVEQGTFVISPDNLATVAGARELRFNIRPGAPSAFTSRLPQGRIPGPQDVRIQQQKAGQKEPPNP